MNCKVVRRDTKPQRERKLGLPSHKLAVAFIVLLAPIHIFAAEGAPSWIENTLYGSGKMNAVLAVVMIILIGLAIWMFGMDRKLRRAEKELDTLRGKEL